MTTAIKVEALSKQYRLGNVGTGSLAHDINRAWHLIRGNDDPYLKIGENNDRTQKAKSDYVWALKDVSFEVRQGEVLGIIGRNGAGKSTVLKILSRITNPTTGVVKIKGAVASLLEVGTGFHPELTGRENLFLNGAILGMTKSEIKKKFDEIVDFAGVERYIDTPVKRYSSGMYVRLAFAVAANLEPEILIVDEVLAVGDGEFQKKCLGKMKDVSEKDGRTVLFVSHNTQAIQQLCNRLVYLKSGAIEYEGDVMQGLSFYHKSFDSGSIDKKKLLEVRSKKNKKAFIVDFDVKLDLLRSKLETCVIVNSLDDIEKVEIAIGINDSFGVRLVTFHSRFTNEHFNLKKGINEFICEVNNFFLKPEKYTINIFLGNRFETIDFLDEAIEFEIPDYLFYSAGIIPDTSQGALMAHHHWQLNEHRC